MSSFIREPWIHSLLCAQLYQNAIPSTSQRCQLIDIVGKSDVLEVIVSDRVHSITTVLSRESIANFKKIYAMDWVDVKGCLMTLDRFYFEYSFEKNAFFIYTEDFSYFGSEGEIIGDPISVNHAKDIKDVLSHGICGKLHISELDILYCVVEREANERRRALDLILENPTGGHAEALSRFSNGGENMATLLKKDDSVGTCANETETGPVQACEIIATRSEDQTTSFAQNGDDRCCLASSSSAESVVIYVSNQEECVDNNSNRQHSMQEKCTAEGNTSNENVVHAPERSDCRKTDEPVFSQYDATVCSVQPHPASYKKEKGVIDFHDLIPTTNFDLSIFTRRKKNRTPDNNST